MYIFLFYILEGVKKAIIYIYIYIYFFYIYCFFELSSYALIFVFLNLTYIFLLYIPCRRQESHTRVIRLNKLWGVTEEDWRDPRRTQGTEAAGIDQERINKCKGERERCTC